MTNRRAHLAPVLSLCMALLPSVKAGAEEPTATRLLQQGIALFADGDFSGSIRVLRHAQSQTSNKRLLGQIHLYLGLDHASVNHLAAARSAFRKALANDPRLRIDPQRHKPAFVKLFGTIRQTIVGELVVTVDPPGTEQVRVDGQVVGPAPVRQDLLSGRHAVQVRDPGGVIIFDKQVNIAAGQSIRLVVVGKNQRERKEVTVFPPNPRKDKGHRSRPWTWTWITAGGAVASAAVAIGSALSATSDHDTGCKLLADSAIPCDQRTTLIRASDAQRYAELRQDVSNKVLVTNIAAVTAAVLGATAVLIYWLEGRARPERSTVKPSLRAAGTSLSISF